jgi:hypothetical protein
MFCQRKVNSRQAQSDIYPSVNSDGPDRFRIHVGLFVFSFVDTANIPNATLNAEGCIKCCDVNTKNSKARQGIQMVVKERCSGTQTDVCRCANSAECDCQRTYVANQRSYT